MHIVCTQATGSSGAAEESPKTAMKLSLADQVATVSQDSVNQVQVKYKTATTSEATSMVTGHTLTPNGDGTLGNDAVELAKLESVNVDDPEAAVNAAFKVISSP